MIKYEIYKETDVEMCFVNDNFNFSTDDLIDYYENSRTSSNSKLIKSFDTKKEAKEFFEQEKFYCHTSKEKTGELKYFLFDVLTLTESEYENNNELLQWNDYEIYIADDKCLKANK